MPIYNFDFEDNYSPRLMTNHQLPARNAQGAEEPRPMLKQLPLEELKAETRSRITFEQQNINFSEEVREMLPQGYRTMDMGIKNYFSGMRVPTSSEIRIMQVRISGGDKPFLIWSQDVKNGRVILPVMSIKRESEEFYPEKFSTPHQLYFSRRYANADFSKVFLSPRPVPTKVNYSLSVWAETRSDLEYIQYQIVSRFNPIAEFLVEDEYLRMTLVLHYNGMTSAVDDEVPPDQRANKRYDYSIQMEGYLPLPERLVPTILGRVTTLKDGGERFYGDVLQAATGKLNIGK